MDKRLLGRLQARSPAIRGEWETLLRIEGITPPADQPQALQRLIDRTLTEVFATLAAEEGPHQTAPPRHARAIRLECECGRNPLLAYFLAGERAMLEALVRVQATTRSLPPEVRDKAVAELYLVLRGIARREVKSSCSLCPQLASVLPPPAARLTPAAELACAP